MELLAHCPSDRYYPLLRGMARVSLVRMFPVKSAPARVIGALVAVYGLRLVVLRTGLDHVTTLETWSNPICAIAGVVAGAAFAWFSGRNWFTPPSDRTVSPWIANLRQDDFLIWCLLGAAVTVGFSILSAIFCANLVGVGAQYLDGVQDSFSATVISEKTINYSRAFCKIELQVIRSSDAATLTICLATPQRPSLASAALEPSKPVTVHVLDTPLGVVVQSVEPQ